MLYIAVALYPEAHPWIAHYQLKQNHEETKFQIFESDQVSLIITGTGALKAGIALTYLLSRRTITSHDFFINYGCCGAVLPSILSGTTYICNKIKQMTTQYTVYPDLLDSLSFPESSITTCDQVLSSNTRDQYELIEPLVDMEAYGLYKAAVLFFHLDQILFLKTVTDHLDTPGVLDPNMLKEAVTRFADEYTSVILPRLSKPVSEKPALSQEEDSIYQMICTSLHLSITMQLTLHQHLIYHKCMHKDTGAYLTQFYYSEQLNDCHSKTEGKRYYARLITELSR